jgi:hypothetical protein
MRRGHRGGGSEVAAAGERRWLRKVEGVIKVGGEGGVGV